MEENNIIDAVRAFQKEKISKRELLKELNDLILKTPNYYGYFDKDVKYEFYAYLISKIEKIISCYREIPEATFTTWFNVVLKRQFYLFIKKYKTQEQETVEYIENINGDQCNCRSSSINRYNFDFSHLTEKELIIFRLKYGIYNFDDELKESNSIIIDKLNRKRIIEDKIAGKYHMLINLQKQIQLESDKTTRNNLKERLAKVVENKRQLESKFSKFSMLPTNKWVGNKLGLSAGTVGAYLNKIKIKIKKNNNLKENLD